jgi:hypothetical protein
MKKLIKKILKEEVHPDYENLIEGDNYKLGVNIKELKLIVYILKNYHKSVTSFKEAFKELGINNDVLLTKVILIISFNSGIKLMNAYKTKDLSKIYDGPFYKAEVEHYDDIYNDTEYHYDECPTCSGEGSLNDECYYCDGSGEIEDDAGEYIECNDCDGDGQVEVECDECYGSGSYELEVDVERISYYRSRVIAKEPITSGLLGDDIRRVIKNPNILTLSPYYIDNEYELVDDGGIDKDKEFRIEDIYGDDIIVRGESIY